MQSKLIYTIGHSDHAIGEFIDLLKENGIACLMDVRRFPTSKRYPQFKEKNLADCMFEENIQYEWLGEQLGGFRSEDYEAYMQKNEFVTGLAKLTTVAINKKTAIMCAERSYRECHRRFISQALRDQGWQVLHILGLGQVSGHQEELI